MVSNNDKIYQKNHGFKTPHPWGREYAKIVSKKSIPTDTK